MDATRLLSLFILVLIPSASSQTAKSSQVWSLLRLRHLLGEPAVLSVWANSSNPCSLDPSPSVTVVCYGQDVTQLHISGFKNPSPLPNTFSIDSFFTTLTRLQSLKVLSLSSLGLFGVLPGQKLSHLTSLEILNLSQNSLSGPLPIEICVLSNLQSLILDHNQLSGELPHDLGKLTRLAVLSARNNSFSGELPSSISTIDSLRVLVFPSNKLSGRLPNLAGLSNLQILDLSDNQLGPDFPKLGKKIATMLLRNNSFTGALPSDMGSYHLLQRLDLSHNRFVGPFPTSLFSLTSIRYLDISMNKFTGLLISDLSCNDGLEFVDVSFNLLVGSLPECLVGNVSFMMNCLSDGGQPQHPSVFCKNQALAVGMIPKKKHDGLRRKVAVVVGLVAAAMTAVGVLVVAGVIVARRVKRRKGRRMPPRWVLENAFNGYSSKLLSDARYISQTMKLGALGIPPYRSFSLEELQAAINSFEASAFFDEGSQNEMYWGRLNDRSLAAIRCLKLKRSLGSRSLSFTRYIELFSKLRHRHLVSALGHCFEYHLDDSSISRVFLVYEHVNNGTLRRHLCEKKDGNMLSWSQRISAAIGVVKGIQFLHAGILPGLSGNGIKATDVLLDHNLVAKICSYNLPIMAEKMDVELGLGDCPSTSKGTNDSDKNGEKEDVYDFGVILLEVITGEPITTSTDINRIKDQVEAGLTAEGMGSSRRTTVDAAVRGDCCDASLRTVMEICIRCIADDPYDRPSVEDILWNLQFAAQVQESWRGEALSGNESPVLA